MNIGNLPRLSFLQEWHRRAVAGFYLLVAFWSLCAQAESRATRVALVAPVSLGQIADVATAELTPFPVELVERAEIARILQEQKLASFSAPADAIRVGRLLQADGVILLSADPDGKTFSARLAAVNSGVILEEMTAPVSAGPDGARELAKRLGRFLPKLALPPAAVVPVSILNLRSAVHSSTSELLDRTLTLMLTRRLVQVPEIVVLERRQLDALAAEKEQAPSTTTEFLKSAYLVDGLIDAHDVRANRVTLDLQVRRMGAEGETISVTGERANLGAMVEEAAAKLIQSIAHGQKLPPWNAAQEAKRYADEGRWSSRWAMTPEAESALEAAWALGERTRDVSMPLIRAYAYHVDRQAAAAYYRANPSVVNDTPYPDLIAKMLRALSRYRGDSEAGLGTPSFRQDKDWYLLGVQIVEQASILLRAFTFDHAAPVPDDTLAELRAAIRDNASFISQANPPARDYGIPFGSPDLPRFTRQLTIDELRVEYGGYWYETAAQAFAGRAALLAGQGFTEPADIGLLRKLVFIGGSVNVLQGFPRLADWHKLGPAGLEAERQKFLSALCTSDRPAEKIYGGLLKLQTLDGAAFAPATQAALDLLWSERESIFSGQVNFDCASLTLGVINARCESASNDANASLLRDVLAPFELKFAAAYLAQAQQTSPDLILSLLPSSFICNNLLTPENKAKLRELLAIARPLAGRDTRALAAYERSLPAAPPASLPSNSPAKPAPIPAPNATGTPSAAVERISDALPSPPAGCLVVSRVWESASALAPALQAVLPPPKNFPAGVPYPPFQNIRWDKIIHPVIVAMCVREGRVWVELRLNGPVPGGFQGAICSIDPANLATGAVLFRPASHAWPRGAEPRSFEVWRGDLYVSAGDHLEKYNRASHQWEKIEVPISRDAMLFAVHDHLYLTTNDAILQFEPASRSVRVLASSRRLPALNLLDRIDPLGYPPVFAGPGQKIRTKVGDRLYEGDPVTGQWTLLAEEPHTAVQEAREGVLLYEGAFRFNRVAALRESGGAPEMLLDDSRSDLPRFPGPARWSAPAAYQRTIGNSDPARKGAAFLGNTLVLLLGPIARRDESAAGIVITDRQPFPEGHTVLYRFRPGVATPDEIPLWFAYPQAVTNVKSIPPLRMAPVGFLLAETPAGLFITEKYRPDIWILPQADLDKFPTVRVAPHQ